jgi:hypothetical protein
MRNISKICAVSVITLLVACQQSDNSTEGKPLIDIANTDLVQLCERADLQDSVLDIFVEAMFKRNVTNAGLLGSFYNQGLSEEKARQETSIENARAKRHSTDQVDCTVDFVNDVSSDNAGISEVKFADAQYSLIQQPDNSYQVVPKKASFFANIFIDGISREAWKAQAQREAQSAREADEAASNAGENEDPQRSQDVEGTQTSNDSESRPATTEEAAEIRRIAKERGMVVNPHGDGFDVGSSEE